MAVKNNARLPPASRVNRAGRASRSPKSGTRPAFQLRRPPFSLDPPVARATPSKIRKTCLAI